MRKVIFLLLLFFSSSSFAQPDVIDIRTLSVKEKNLLLDRFNAGLEKLSKNLDSMLTRNGMVKTLIVTIPFLTLYAYLFPPEPVGELLGRIFNYSVSSVSRVGINLFKTATENTQDLEVLISALGEFEGKYQLSKQIGSTEAFWSMLYEKPLSSLSLLLSSATDKIWNAGIPFLSVILANKLLKVQ